MEIYIVKMTFETLTTEAMSELAPLGTYGQEPTKLAGENKKRAQGFFITGNVGIGTTGPSTALDVVGDVNVTGPAGEWIRFTHSDAANTYMTFTDQQITVERGSDSGGGLILATSATGAFHPSGGHVSLKPNGTNALRATINEEVLIATTTDSGTYKLQVNGEICETTAGTAACSSDARLKENIKPLEPGLPLILSLEPKEFNFIGNEETVAGLIAQDIQQIRPNWIIPHDDDAFITFDDKGYIQNGLIKAIQEQQAQIQDLRKEIQALKESNPPRTSDKTPTPN